MPHEGSIPPLVGGIWGEIKKNWGVLVGGLGVLKNVISYVMHNFSIHY